MSFNMENLTQMQRNYILSAALSSMTDVDWKCVLACSGPEFELASSSIRWVNAYRFATANHQLSEEQRFTVIGNLWKTCCLSVDERTLIIQMIVARDHPVSRICG